MRVPILERQGRHGKDEITHCDRSCPRPARYTSLGPLRPNRSQRLRNIFSSLLRTSTACAVQPRLFCFKNGTFDGVADIDCAVDRVPNPGTHVFWMRGYATRFKNFRKYSVSHGKLTLVMPTETALHVRPMIAQIFHEFAMMRARDTHPRSSEGGNSSTLNL